jgi:hypothetical protein
MHVAVARMTLHLAGCVPRIGFLVQQSVRPCIDGV